MAWVDNTQVAGTLSATASTATFSPVIISGLNVQLQYYAVSTSPTLRAYLTLSNPTGSAITVPVDYANNFGRRGTTMATSDGDTSFTTGDRWIVTDDSSIGGDVANLSVLYGPGSPQETPTFVSTTVFNCDWTEGVLVRFDSVTVLPGDSVALMFFQEIHSTSSGAIAAAPAYNVNPIGDRLAGLTADDLCKIVNWDFCPVDRTFPGANGDPHFITWAGNWYDFQGACDMHLLVAPHFAPNQDLVIDIRTKIRYDYSYIESAVVKIGDETLEVASFGDYYLNGIGGVDASDMTLSGFSINYTHLNENVHIFEIIIAPGESIVVKTFKDMVAVKLDNADATRFYGSHGMMGDFDSHGKMLGRDGVTLVEDPNAFAAEWQVRDDEPMLFQFASGPQYPQECVLPSPKKESRRLGESIAIPIAEKACAGWPSDAKAACIHDVMATGDLELAEAGAF